MREKRTVLHAPDRSPNPGLDFRGLKIKKKGDDFIIEKGDDPNAIPMEATELINRIEADHLHDALGNRGATADPHFGSIRTQRATAHDDSVKRTLLNIARKPREIGLDETIKIPMEGGLELELQSKDDRPLIDKLHEATFSAPVGLQWIEDKYALRTIIRKAHCFTLDAVTSALVADFSLAIASDLESARRMAIPPFPVTWIEIDNIARLDRVKALGIPLTDTAAGKTEAGPPVDRVGWLIHPAEKGGYYASYCAQFDSTMMIAPLTYWWHTDAAREAAPSSRANDDVNYFHQVSAFGINNSNARWEDAGVSTMPINIPNVNRSEDVRDLMIEIRGELRHIWGFLIALGAGQLGMEAKYSAQPKPTTVRTMKNGKPLLPIEHKVLHLHLAKKMTPDKVVLRMITHHRHR